MLFIFPRPLVFKHAIAQPWEAQAQTLYPLRFEGAKWIPCVMYPNFSPFTIFALPLVNIVIELPFYLLQGNNFPELILVISGAVKDPQK